LDRRVILSNTLLFDETRDIKDPMDFSLVIDLAPKLIAVWKFIRDEFSQKKCEMFID